MSAKEDIAILSAKEVKNIFERYNYDVTTKYVPHSPSKNILKILSKRKGFQKCPHYLYSTPSSFINHILWLLYPTTPNIEHAQHCKAFVVYCNYNGLSSMCTNCINILLSTVHFKDLINLYNVWARDRFIVCRQTYNLGILTILHHSIRHHPKIHKIMLKVCKLNRKIYENGEKLYRFNDFLYAIHCAQKLSSYDYHIHDFDCMCDLLSSSCQFPSNYILYSLNTLFLSMKYWNKYHVLYFLSHRYFELENELKRLLMSQKLYAKRDGMLWTMIAHSMSLILKHGAYKYIDSSLLKKDDNLMKKIKIYYHPEIKLEIQNERKRTKEHQKRYVQCSWNNCNEMQSNSDQSFKVCGKCKMAYYCSKSCQKKSWNMEHRINCKILCGYYSL